MLSHLSLQVADDGNNSFNNVVVLTRIFLGSSSIKQFLYRKILYGKAEDWCN